MLITCRFGAANTAQAVFYRVLNADTSVYQARTSSGVTELVAGSGEFGVEVADAVLAGRTVVWDIDGTSKTCSEAFWTGVDGQAVRDAMQLAPSGGSAAAGSIDSKVDALVAPGGNGANVVTVTVTGGGSPLEGASVRLTKGGVSYVLAADASGVATFTLDAGTYALAVSLAGWSYTSSNVVVDGVESVAVSMTQVGVPAPTEPDTCVCYTYTRTAAGAAAAGGAVTFRLTRVDGLFGSAYDAGEVTVTSGLDGLAQLSLPCGATAALKLGTGQWFGFCVPLEQASYMLPSVIV